MDSSLSIKLKTVQNAGEVVCLRGRKRFDVVLVLFLFLYLIVTNGCGFSFLYLQGESIIQLDLRLSKEYIVIVMECKYQF